MEQEEQKEQKEQKEQEQERIKLDQSLRLLFGLSKRLTVQLINGLFDEQFAVEDVRQLHHGNGEFVIDSLERIIGDLFLTVETARGRYEYHVEFQTLHDRSMVIRMFRYGFEKAQELARNRGGAGREEVLVFPRQVVIFLEENEQIGEQLHLRLQLPDGSEVSYRVPVMDYWTYSAEDLRRQQLAALLPLQVFRSRKRLQQIAASRMPEAEKRRHIAEEFARLQNNVQQVLAVLRELIDANEVELRTVDRLLYIMEHILTYLYQRYGAQFRRMKEEVVSMAKSYYMDWLNWDFTKRAWKKGWNKG